MKRTSFRAAVVGASAGGSGALSRILPRLPSDFPLSVIVVQHVHPRQSGLALFYQDGALPAKDADEKEPIFPGVIYFAPPNYHLLVEDDFTFSLSIDPKVNFSRPAVDVLFESAADAYGAGLIAVVLGGSNRDGVEGLQYVKRRGGLTVVQNPRDADSRFAPQAAIKAVSPHYVLSAVKIAELLLELTLPLREETR